MTTRISLCLPLALMLSALGPLPQEPTAGPKHTITGTVSNALTGEPIGRALVQLMGQIYLSTLTGPDGRFSFDEVPEGPVGFRFVKPGFHDLSSMRGNSQYLQNEPLKVGSGSNDFALKLYPAARISGHVTDTNGEPIEGASVQVLVQVLAEGRPRWQRSGEATATDEDGSFEFEHLPPGLYLIYCGGHEIPPMTWNGPREVYPPIYYPDARDKTSAQAVELQPGQQFSADFHLHRDRGYMVEVQVDGLPARAGLTLEDSSAQTYRQMRADRQPGRFTADGVPSGSWVIALRAGDQQGRTFETRQEFTVDHADLTGIQMQAHPGVTIPVVVNPSATSEERSGGWGVDIRARLIPDKGPEDRGYFARIPGIFRQGNFIQGDPLDSSFKSVPPGRYKLGLRTYARDCVSSATYGNVDLMQDELVLGPDAGAQPVVLNLGTDCAVLKVVGVKAEGRNPFLVIIPTPGVLEPIGQPLKGQVTGGEFTLPQGTYQVFAFENEAGVEYVNPGWMRNYSGQSVTLEAGQEKDITLEITKRKDH